MRVAALLFLAAAAFAWATNHGSLRLHSSGATPPAIVLPRSAVPEARRGAATLGVPRKVEQATVRALEHRDARHSRG